MTDEIPAPVSAAERPSAEFLAFLTALSGVDAAAPTRCPGWTAHDLLAHLVAGAQEITRLVSEVLAGRPAPATRGLDQREAPLREIPDADLRSMLVTEGGRLGAALRQLHGQVPTCRVPFTGWAMTAGQLQTHLRSELALHRWDLVGDDEVGDSLLGQADLLTHAFEVRRHMTGLAEARRPPAKHLEDLDLSDAQKLLTIWGRVVGG